MLRTIARSVRLLEALSRFGQVPSSSRPEIEAGLGGMSSEILDLVYLRLLRTGYDSFQSIHGVCPLPRIPVVYSQDDTHPFHAIFPQGCMNGRSTQPAVHIEGTIAGILLGIKEPLICSSGGSVHK